MCRQYMLKSLYESLERAMGVRVGVCDSLCFMHLTLGVFCAFKPIFCLNLNFEFKLDF